jgi:hypothetical protein
MSWSDAHRVSEELANEAHVALRAGSSQHALALFLKAAEAEEKALSLVSPIDKPRTFGITAVSTVALWYKGGELSRAESSAYKVLSNSDVVEPFVIDQLRTLLQTIWNVRAQQAAGVKFVPGQVQISVRGGEVVKGGAPLDLIVEKVQTIQSLFYRTTEFLTSRPFRRNGPAPKDIQETCRPWLFQGVPASYQFVVAIERPKQIDAFDERGLDPQLVASTFLSIIEAAANDPSQGLAEIVPDPQYKAAFLKLTRNLSPTGKVFSQMEVKAAGDARCVLLVAESRKTISQTLRIEAPTDTKQFEPVEVKGILRAVHLDKDWMEVQVEEKHIRINDVGEALDDVIGPMMNRQVTVQTGKDQSNKLHFRDIEADE